MPRPLKDPNEPKAQLNEQQRAQLDKARAAGAKKRQENALLKKAAKQEEKEQAQKERQEKLLAAKNKLEGKKPVEENKPIEQTKSVEQTVDETLKEPEQNNIKPEPVAKEPKVEKPIQNKIVDKPIEKPKKSSKDAYYEYKLKMLQNGTEKNDYNPISDAHTVAKNNLHSHFSKEIMRDMWLANFGENERMPDKYL